MRIKITRDMYRNSSASQKKIIRFPESEVERAAIKVRHKQRENNHKLSAISCKLEQLTKELTSVTSKLDAIKQELIQETSKQENGDMHSLIELLNSKGQYYNPFENFPVIDDDDE